MTESQKSQIKTLRKEGLSFGNIASTLNLSVNTVKSFCRRNLSALETETEIPTDGICRYCGRPVMRIAGRKEKKFCSDKCRMNFWKEHPDELNKKAIYSFECTYCHKPFTAYGNSHRKYCCHECYIEDRFGGGSHE